MDGDAEEKQVLSVANLRAGEAHGVASAFPGKRSSGCTFSPFYPPALTYFLSATFTLVNYSVTSMRELGR